MKNNGKNRTTIRDVALHANVSIATVSRALSNSDYPISDELRQRVQTSAELLGYTPNSAAQSLRSRRSSEIGLIIPSVSNPFYLQAINGIDSVISREEKMLVLCNTEHEIAKERKYLEMLHARNALGAIISSVDTEPDTINKFVRHGMKIVLLDQQIQGANCPVISTNMRNNGKMAVRYLHKLGHRRIAFATTPLTRWTRQEIHRGYLEALTSLAIDPDPRLLFVGKSFDHSRLNDLELNAGTLAAEQFLENDCDATAVICINDMVAFGFINYLTRQGTRVPGDISVMAFDDIPLAGVYCPPLTTVRYPSEQMGRLAAMMLTDSISSNQNLDPLGIQLVPQIVVRQSTSAYEEVQR